MKDKYVLGKQFEFDNHYWFEPQKLGFINLYQIGELCCECGFQVEPHLQVCNEISYIVSGDGWFGTDGKETRVNEGDIYINAKGHVHSIKANDNAPLRYFYMAFEFNEDAQDEIFAPVKRLFSNIENPSTKDKSDIMVPFTKIMDELYSKTEFSNMMIESFAKLIIILTHRSFRQDEKLTPLPIKTINAVGYTVYSVIRYIDNNIYDIHDVKCISENLGYSYSYLSHLFRDKMGITLQNYINCKKIEKAIELMKYGRLSITQVAMKLNYEAVQSFSKSFKRTMGSSPMEYQKKLRESNM